MLTLRGLQASYGKREVLRGIDLEVARREVVGLVGPNGGGKTTLLKAVTGVLRASAGEVLIDGAGVSTLASRDLARRVAIVPQNPTLPVGFTARDVVVMGRTPHLGFFDQEGPDDYRRADEALALVGASALAARRVEELSGGEKQHVVIARALAQATPLLLLDEPTANLDIGHQIGIAKLLRRLAGERDVAVLAALHDLTLASLYCDRIVLMSEGRILATGAPHDVLTRENVKQAYGQETLVLRPEGLSGPIVLPVDADPPSRP